MKTAYTYTLLRYVHDVASGEFANVGVVMFSPTARYAGALCRDTHGRISHLFPDMDRDSFKSLMRYIESQIEAVGARLKDELPLETAPTDAGVLARSVLPHDDSSLQWGPVGGGFCDNPAQKLEDLFVRYVTRYDDKTPVKSRTDEEVWSRFKRALDEKHITAHLQPKKISVQTMMWNSPTPTKTSSGTASRLSPWTWLWLRASRTRRTVGWVTSPV